MPRKKKRTSTTRWSRHVMETSNALDLEGGLFTRNPRGIAEGLKRSAEHRTKDRSKSRSDYQAAMSMLNFYINRAGRNLPTTTKNRLEKAKGELKKLYRRG